MKLVYFGNKLSLHGRSKSVLETLEPLIADFCEVKTFSSVRNQYLRLLDMIYHFFKEGLVSDTIMIDVYSTKNFYFAYILGWLCKIYKKPYILFLHGGNLPRRYKKSKGKIHQIFKPAACIVAPSNYLKSFFESQGFKIKLIPNVIDLQKFPFLERRFCRPRLLYVRGFGKIYNPKMTVRAVKELQREYPNVELAMIGSDIDGSLDEVQGLINHLKLEKNILILGRKTQEEWTQISKNFDIMISNPLIDNAPVSIIEGMALGLLIISTNVGGVSYIVNDKYDGMLVKSGDHLAVAAAVRELLNNPVLCSSLQRNARRKAELFSWKNICPEWQNLFNYCSERKIEVKEG